MSDPDMPTDEKYATFKMEHALSITDGYITFRTSDVLPDAVVIRRQDKFASPCLATYAAMIGLVAMNHTDAKVRADLLDISDYFERQAALAADEGYKLPDL
jgi:hypothetical protein